MKTDCITTYTGEDFTPFAPDINQIKIEDIAHALSLICRANGHFTHFYSVAQHCVNCAAEAKARGLSIRLQKACLLHDGSEAYLSDITRPLKRQLDRYLEFEKALQDMIYTKFLGSPLSGEECAAVCQVDNDMLAWEFNALMEKKVFNRLPEISGNPSFKFRGFTEVENEFLEIYAGAKHLLKDKSLRIHISDIENELKFKSKEYVIGYVRKHRVSEILAEKQYLKKISLQVDVAIHAYGILSALPHILEDGEAIEYLSLGAGNTGKAYDLATSKRIAEFKFAVWDIKNNTVRQDGIFQNFLELAASTERSGKKKYIYCLSAAEIIRFLSSSERGLASVLSRSSTNKKHLEYQKLYKTVKSFYADFRDEVEIVELGNILDGALLGMAGLK